MQPQRNSIFFQFNNDQYCTLLKYKYRVISKVIYRGTEPNRLKMSNDVA